MLWHVCSILLKLIEQMSTFGGRLVEERSRLGLSQEDLADATGMSKRALGNYERGGRSPDAEQLIRLRGRGVDIFYVLTGERLSSRLDLDPMRRALLDTFDRCSPEKQIEAVQHMALLATVPTPPAPTPGDKTRATPLKKTKVAKAPGTSRRP
jgi:transcriptional regulator with XRE-family HTH domain